MALMVGTPFLVDVPRAPVEGAGVTPFRWRGCDILTDDRGQGRPDRGRVVVAGFGAEKNGKYSLERTVGRARSAPRYRFRAK